VLNPAQPLSVQGAVQLLNTPQGTCNATNRGTLDFYSPGGSTKDSLYLCAASATGTLAWVNIY